MRYFGNAASAAVLVLTSLTTALPVKEAAGNHGGATFSVTQVLNPNHVPSGPLAYAKALGRYGAPISEDLKAAVLEALNTTGLLRRQSQSTVTANPSGGYDSEYLSPVSIGNPAQSLNLDFDTGSADLWVFSSQTPTNQRGGQTIYTPGTSAKQLNGATWSISYGDGSGASGNVFSDRVAVGGVTATTQAVEAATAVSASFSGDSASSGLLGLAFSSINTVTPTRQKTFFENVQSSLAAPLFTSKLKYHAAGSYGFGFVDNTQYTGNIAYTPVDSSAGFWGFTGSGYAVGTHPFTAASINAVADTGTSLLLVPQAAVTAYYAQVRGATNNRNAGGYTFPCTTTLPSFTFGVGSYRGVIPGQYLNYAPLSAGSATCFGGIQSNAGIGMSIYGDIMLKSQYMVWNGANPPTLGFAQQSGISSTPANGDAPTTTTSGGGGFFGLGNLLSSLVS